MTKKDYVAIADAIDRTTVSRDHEIVFKVSLIDALVSIFRRDNPRFDTDRFIKACSNE